MLENYIFSILVYNYIYSDINDLTNDVKSRIKHKANEFQIKQA